jgi:SAM-dependent methyltransferase
MHGRSYDLMAKHLSRVDLAGKSVLDVGSYDINGSYRELVEGRMGVYTGLDVRPGKNVDIVSRLPYNYPFPNKSFDVVICGNALHNISMPWCAIQEFARLLPLGGLLVVVTIYSWSLNPHPGDYFRMTDRGLEVLFDMTGLLTDYRLEIDDYGNTAGSAISR